MWPKPRQPALQLERPHQSCSTLLWSFHNEFLITQGNLWGGRGKERSFRKLFLCKTHLQSSTLAISQSQSFLYFSIVEFSLQSHRDSSLHISKGSRFPYHYLHLYWQKTRKQTNGMRLQGDEFEHWVGPPGLRGDKWGGCHSNWDWYLHILMTLSDRHWMNSGIVEMSRM